MAHSRLCSIPGCDKPHLAKGWCSAHWHRARRNNGDPLIDLPPYAKRGEPLEYFRKVVCAYEGDDCLIWPFGRGEYARMHIGKRSVLVSRLACEAIHGSPPSPTHEAAHSCGKGHLRCVNPHHLSWKTPAQNWADRYLHGTDNSGERNGRWRHGRFAGKSSTDELHKGDGTSQAR